MVKQNSTPRANRVSREDQVDEVQQTETPNSSRSWLKHLIVPFLIVAYLGANNWVEWNPESAERAERSPFGRVREMHRRDQCTQWKGATDANYDSWCQNNCAAGYCPDNYCKCVQSTTPPAQGACKQWKGNTPQYNDWCASNCAAGYCPETYCSCASTSSDPTCNNNQRQCKNGMYSSVDGSVDAEKFCRSSCNAPEATDCPCSRCQCSPEPVVQNNNEDGFSGFVFNTADQRSITVKSGAGWYLDYDTGAPRKLVASYAEQSSITLQILDSWQGGGQYSVTVDGVQLASGIGSGAKTTDSCGSNVQSCQGIGGMVKTNVTIPAGSHQLVIERTKYASFSDFFFRLLALPVSTVCSLGQFQIDPKHQTYFSDAACPSGHCLASIDSSNIDAANQTLAQCGSSQAWIASWNTAASDCLELVSQSTPAVVTAGSCNKYLPSLCQQC